MNTPTEKEELFFTNPLTDPNTKFIDTTGTGRFALANKNCMTRKQFDQSAIALFLMALRTIAMTKGGHKCNKIAFSTLKEYEKRCKETIFVPEPDNHPVIGGRFKAPNLDANGEPIPPPDMDAPCVVSGDDAEEEMYYPSGRPPLPMSEAIKQGLVKDPNKLVVAQNEIMEQTSVVEGYTK